MAADKPKLHIGHLFVAGIITAAGAGLFWGIASLCRSAAAGRRESNEDRTGSELDAMLISAEAASIE